MDLLLRSVSTMARVVLWAAVAALAIAAFSQDAQAKGEARAVLERPIPADAEPGSTIPVAWKLEMKTNDGYEPFGAGEVFLRLVGRSSGESSEVVVDGTGSFSARVKVPPSGIKRVEIGVIGYRTAPENESTRSDWLFPIAGPSLEQPSQVSGEPGPNMTAIGLALALVVLLLLVGGILFRRRAMPTPATQ